MGFIKEVVLPTVVAVGLFFGIGAGLANWLGSYECSNYKEVTGTNTQWITLDTCYISTENGWMRWEEDKKRS